MTQGTYQHEEVTLPWVDGATVEAFWHQFAQASLDWLTQSGVSVRDAVVVLPFAQHLVLARRAFAARVAWPPRLETTRSLASALAPPALPQPGQLSGDAAVDALMALGRLDAAGLLAGADRRGQGVRAERVQALALALRQAADAQHPAQRPVYWTQAGALLAQSGGEPLEAALCQLAWRWAQEGPQPATDALFNHPAAAWVLLEAGRPDPLAQAVLRASASPCLRLHLAAPQQLPVPAWTQTTLPDGAALAQATAAHVVAAVARGEAPVLLPATDRALVRRVLALLAPYGLLVADETGVSLATQAPAAALRHLLQAALQGGMDDALAWAKGPLAPTNLGDVAPLEAWARRHRHTQWQGAAPDRGPQVTWRRLSWAAAPLRDGAVRRPLGAWLGALRDALVRCEALTPDRWPAADQAAWRVLCETLWLTRSPWPGSAVAQAMATPLTGAAWLSWLDDVLQAPAPSMVGAQGAQVVVTPLGRALLRPFGHCVLAGCDPARWTLGPVAPALVSQATALALGLPDRVGAQEAQWQALVQTLRLERATWLHAGHEGGVALEWAPPVQRLRALWGDADLPTAAEARSPDQPAAAPLLRQAQACTGWLPARLSASQVEALRECPYRFLGRVRLGLGRAEEIDLDPDARDWGRWLHAVLERAHALGDPAQTWEAACDQVLAEQGLAAGADAPFRALLQRWGPAYLAWWAAQGATEVLATERRLNGRPWADDPVLEGVNWTGVIDRLDATPQGERRLLDFKAGSSAGVVERLKDDTQLPFYAVLMALEGEPVDSAAYLAYESKSGGLKAFASPETPDTPDLATRAETLRLGLADDFRALHAGEPLRALGEGRACEHCEMRGLCRREDWQA